MILIANWLSSHIVTGPFLEDIHNSDDADLMHSVFFATVAAAVDSALVELSVVIDCALD